MRTRTISVEQYKLLSARPENVLQERKFSMRKVRKDTEDFQTKLDQATKKNLATKLERKELRNKLIASEEGLSKSRHDQADIERLRSNLHAEVATLRC